MLLCRAGDERRLHDGGSRSHQGAGSAGLRPAQPVLLVASARTALGLQPNFSSLGERTLEFIVLLVNQLCRLRTSIPIGTFQYALLFAMAFWFIFLSKDSTSVALALLSSAFDGSERGERDANDSSGRLLPEGRAPLRDDSGGDHGGQTLCQTRISGSSGL